jgi:hypothetical protein
MISFESLPFDKAITFFRDRTVLTPDKYNHLTAEARAKAFTVSGVTRMDVLTDIHGAIDRAIAEGTTFADFKKAMKETMARRGWEGLSPTGSTRYPHERPGRLPGGPLPEADGGRRQSPVLAVRGRDGCKDAPGPCCDEWEEPSGTTTPLVHKLSPERFQLPLHRAGADEGEVLREKLSIEEDAPGIADPGFSTNPGEVSYRDVLAAKNIDLSSREKWV